MGCMKTFGILTSVLIIGLSVYLYTPLPDDISEPWKVRSFLAMFKLVNLVCKISEMTGYDSKLNMTRTIIRVMTPNTPVSMSDPLLKVTDTTFDGIKVRMYRPKKAKTPRPALVYFHGGGWTIGSIEYADAFCAELSKKANIVVVNVEYRLAPEHPFPVPFEDCVTATLHLLQNYDQYGVHGDKIAVGGDSAGGNLAAAVALLFSTNDNLPNVSLQLIIYPPIQPLDFRLPSYRDSARDVFLSPLQMVEYWSNYIGQTTHPNLPEAMLDNQHTSPFIKKSYFAEFVNISLHLPSEFLGDVEPADLSSGNETLWKEIESNVLNPYMSPLFALKLDMVPPAIVVSAKYDVLLDETVLFAERLKKSGVKVIHRHYNEFHGFFPMLTLFKSSQKAAEDISSDVKNHFEAD